MLENKSIKILFIDDEPLYIKSYGDALEAAGFTLVSATNGEDALKKIQEEKFDLLIVDLIMPVLGGISFLKKIRRKKTPVIVFTTLEGETDREDALKYGAKLFLKKGETNAQDLVTKVKEIISI